MDGTTKSIIDECVSTLKRQMTYISSEERIALWANLRNGYCRNCGDYVGDDVCHCENDE